MHWAIKVAIKAFMIDSRSVRRGWLRSGLTKSAEYLRRDGVLGL